MSPTRRIISVDIYTSAFRVVGKVETSSSGLIGVLNDETTSYITLRDVSIARLHMPTKLIARYSVVQMTKRGIHVACVASRELLGPVGWVRGGFQKVVQYDVFAASQTFEFRGNFNWTGKFDPMAILVQGKSDFLSFYDGKVRAILFPNVQVEAPGMLVNRRKIDIFARVL